MSISPHNAPNQSASIWQIDVLDLFSKNRRIPIKDLSLFCRKAAILFSSGLSVKDIIPLLAQQNTGSTLHHALSAIHTDVMQGKSLTHSLENSCAFPPFMCGYMHIGEQTAQLPKVCHQLADYYAHQVKSQSELRAAMIYPMIVTMMMLGVIIMALTLILPGYADLFAASGTALPALTRGLIDTSEFIQTNGLPIFIISMTIIITAAALRQRYSVRYFLDRVKLKLPVFHNIYQKGIQLQVTQSLALLLSAGVSLSDALNLCGEVADNLQVKNDLRDINIAVGSGQNLWTALENIKYVELMFVHMIQVGEETGTLAAAAERCRQYFETEYTAAIKRAGKLVEPMITLVLGIILAIVVLAIILPTFELAAVM